jgi:MFS family permease
VYLAGVAISASASSMWILIAGLALRGVAAGMMGGLGLGILSGLYPDSSERERAFGLFAAMWVIPSLVGPIVNAALLATVGWRWSMIWPALLLILGRILVSRSLSIVAWAPTGEGQGVRAAGAFAAIACAIVLAQAGVAAPIPWLWAVALGILALALVLPFRLALRRLVPGQSRAQAGGWMLALVCGSYFAVNALVPLLAVAFVDRSGVLGAVLVSLGPLVWAAFSASGLGARIPRRRVPLVAGVAFPSAAILVSGWALIGAESTIGGIIALGLAMLLIGLAMGAAYPRVMTATFEGFREHAGTTRVHGGVVLGVSEDVGTAVGVTALAGIGTVAVALGPSSAGWVCVAGAVVLVALWSLAGRSRLWRDPDR